MLKAMFKVFWKRFIKDVWRGPETDVLHLLVLIIFIIPTFLNMLFMVLGLILVKNFKSMGMYIHVTDEYEVTYFYWWSDFLRRKFDIFRVFWDAHEVRRELVTEA